MLLQILRRVDSRYVFRRSWASLWNNNRKELLRGILGLLRDRPVFLFLTAISILHPSWWSILIVPLALVFNQLIIEIFAKREAIRTQRKILTGFLSIYESPDVISRSATPYKISEYLDWQYDDIDKNLLKRLTGLYGITAFSIDNTVDLYHVTIEGATCPNLICYNIPPLKSYIFLNSAPHEKNQVFKKFCLLHELGHAALHFGATSAFSQHSNKLYFSLAVFLAILCYSQTLDGIFYAIIALLLLLSLAEKVRMGHTKIVNDECNADMLAIAYLDAEERKMLREIFIKYPVKDETLSSAQNEVRYQVLLRNLEPMIADENNEDEALDNVHSRIFKPSFALLIFTCLLVLALAFYAKAAGGYFTLGLFVTCCILLFVFCFYHLMIDVFHKHITDRLAAWR